MEIYGQITYSELSTFTDGGLVMRHPDDGHRIIPDEEKICMSYEYEGIYIKDVLVGYVGYDPETKYCPEMFIHPSARGKGICTRFFNDRDVRKLIVSKSNHDAMRLYKRLGFAISESTDIMHYMTL